MTRKDLQAIIEFAEFNGLFNVPFMDVYSLFRSVKVY